jgi:integrase
MAKGLTALQVAKAKLGMHQDGGCAGLWLQVSGRGAKSWIFRYSLHGRTHDMGLGSASAISLGRARELAAEARALKAEGIDPIDDRRAKFAAARLEAAKTVTFKVAAEQFVTAYESAWSEAHAAQCRSLLARYAYPKLGTLPVQSIESDLVMQVIEPHWRKKPKAMSRLRLFLEKVLSYAASKGYRDKNLVNPARWKDHLEHQLAKPAKTQPVQNHPAMRHQDVPSLMKRLSERSDIAAKALLFTILTGVRTAGTLHAKWSEVDLDEAVWEIPAGRMKNRKPFRVPLSRGAVDILRALPRNGEYIFPNKGKPRGRNALAKVLGLVGGSDATVHGMRSSFRTWTADCTTFPRELAEVALSHTVGDETERAYQRGELLERRRELMQAWDDYCFGRSASIIPMKRKRAGAAA